MLLLRCVVGWSCDLTGRGFLQNKQFFASPEFKQKQFGQDSAEPFSGKVTSWLTLFDSTGNFGLAVFDGLGGNGGGAAPPK